eukprot:1156044-Pelagomonas_calceolata.AAC.3
MPLFVKGACKYSPQGAHTRFPRHVKRVENFEAGAQQADGELACYMEAYMQLSSSSAKSARWSASSFCAPALGVKHAALAGGCLKSSAPLPVICCSPRPLFYQGLLASRLINTMKAH